jgi:hypothetical protein
VIDSGGPEADHASMSAATDKDYIDAKVQAATARMESGAQNTNAELIATLKDYQTEFRQANAASNARMDIIVAQFEANLQRALSETIKWVAGTVIAGVAVSTSVTAFLISNTGQKPAPLQPIVIYAAPPAVPAAPAPPAISRAPK